MRLIFPYFFYCCNELEQAHIEKTPVNYKNILARHPPLTFYSFQQDCRQFADQTLPAEEGLICVCSGSTANKAKINEHSTLNIQHPQEET